MTGEVIHDGGSKRSFVALSPTSEIYLFDYNSAHDESDIFQVPNDGSGVLLMADSLTCSLDLVRVVKDSAGMPTRTGDPCRCTSWCNLNVGPGLSTGTSCGDWGLSPNKCIGLLVLPGLYYLRVKEGCTPDEFSVSALLLSKESVAIQPPSMKFGA